MKKSIALLSLAVLALLASCQMSKAEVESQLRRQFQQSLDTDTNLQSYGMRVRDVTLVKNGSHTYTGYVTVDLDGESHDIGVTVNVDGEDSFFKTDPLAFGFLATRVLDDLFTDDLFGW